MMEDIRSYRIEEEDEVNEEESASQREEVPFEVPRD
jgi:hypothetical protein